MKSLERIPFQYIESIPQLIKDFLNDEFPRFSQFRFSQENIFHKIFEKRQSFSQHARTLISEVLKDQHSGLKLSKKQILNLKSIEKENTFTITTGHQLNFFTGPVFFIYKILQVIKLAEESCSIFSDHHFVPIFWMATEDHDFEEINHFRTIENYYEISAKNGGGAVGKIVLENLSFIEEFKEEFKDSVFGIELIMLMKKAYKKGKTLSEATRILVQELFSQFGLLILDGDDIRLKKQMKKIFEDELTKNSLYTSVKRNVELLKSEYRKIQVNPREINLFYLTETRNRIKKIADRYHIVDTKISFSEEEILNELEQYPQRFSPNALMRPVYQEIVLPNICYIGGNAEVMYWLELTDYFQNLSLPFPVLVPRSSMLFLSEKILKKMEKLKLNIPDLFKNFAALTKDFLLHDHQISTLLNQLEADLTKNFETLKTKASDSEITFYNLVEAEEKRQLRSFNKMRKRLLRSEKIKNSEKLQRMEQLFIKVHPFRHWQERVHNFSIFYSEEGKNWLQNCYSEIHAANSEMIIFSF